MPSSAISVSASSYKKRSVFSFVLPWPPARAGLALFLLDVFTLDGSALSVLTLYRQVWLQCHHDTLVLRQCRAG